jgi:hypothetical protein
VAGGDFNLLARVSTGALDRAVIDAIAPLLAPTWLSQESIEARLRSALILVIASPNKLRVHLDAEALDACAISNLGASVNQSGNACVIEHPITLARPRNATVIIGGVKPTARVDRTLVRAIALARSWADQLETGAVRSVVDLAAAQKRCIHYTNQLLPLAYLAPDLVEMILAGRQPRTLTLSAILAKPLPLDWDAQQAMLEALA